jgi:hypothetical protein
MGCLRFRVPYTVGLTAHEAANWMEILRIEEQEYKVECGVIPIPHLDCQRRDCKVEVS